MAASDAAIQSPGGPGTVSAMSDAEPNALAELRALRHRVRQLEAQVVAAAGAGNSPLQGGLVEILDVFPVGLALLLPDGEWLAVNRHLCWMLGVEREELLKRDWRQVFGEHDLPDAPEVLDGLARAEHGPLTLEGRLRQPSDECTHVLVHARHVSVGGGEKRCVAVTVEDVTVEVHAIAAAREAATYLRQVVDLIPHFVFAKNQQGRFLLVNKAVAEAYGTTPILLLGKTDRDFSATVEEAERFRADDLALIRGETAMLLSEERFADAAGRRRILQIVRVPFRFGSESEPSVLGVAVDVTGLRQAEEALRASQQLLQSVLDHFPGFVYWKDINSVYLGCNRAFARGAGFTEPSEIAGKTDFDLPWAGTAAEKYRADDREVMASGRPKLGIVEPQHLVDGRLIWFRTDKVPLIAASGDVFGLLGIAVDITEVRRLEEQYRHAQRMEAVGALAGGVAHDFNNLLQIVTGYLELAQLKVATAQVPTAELEEIGKAAGRGSSLVRQLLTFSRRQSMQLEHIDVNSVVAGFGTMLRRLIEERIELQTVLSPSLPRVVADAGHLEQVLANLCVNARDAMPEGGLLRVNTRCVDLDDKAGVMDPDARPGTYVVLSVSDTGCGIPEEHLGRIFEPFFTTKEMGKGTGLGLAIVYGIVKQHGGFVEVHSELGKGTVVNVFLPAAQQPPATESEEMSALPLDSGRGETILLAEDDPGVREFAARVLCEAGYRVLLASDGEQALELAVRAGDAVDLYVFDVVMPKLSGRALREAVLARRPTARVLLWSGYGYDAEGRTTLASNDGEMLQKPFTRHVLLRRVRSMLT